jgi:hypothetical protein
VPRFARLENQCGAQFVLRKPFAAKDARVLQHFEQLSLATRSSVDRSTLIFGRSRPHAVNPNATLNVFECDGCSLPVLVAGSLVDQMV